MKKDCLVKALKLLTILMYIRCIGTQKSHILNKETRKSIHLPFAIGGSDAYPRLIRLDLQFTLKISSMKCFEGLNIESILNEKDILFMKLTALNIEQCTLVNPNVH